MQRHPTSEPYRFAHPRIVFVCQLTRRPHLAAQVRRLSEVEMYCGYVRIYNTFHGLHTWQARGAQRLVRGALLMRPPPVVCHVHGGESLTYTVRVCACVCARVYVISPLCEYHGAKGASPVATASILSGCVL